MLKSVATEKAPAAVGPYVQGMEAGPFVYVSGQLPINPETKEMVKDDIQAAARQSLNNCKEILAAAGCSLEQVVKVEIFLDDMNDFAKVNEVYGEFFSDHKPARAAVEVARLPLDGSIEIQMIGYKG